MLSSNTELDTRLEPVYVYLVEYVNFCGYAPSLREIANHCHLNHTTVMRYLDKLQAKGLLTREDGKARSIVLLEYDEQK